MNLDKEISSAKGADNNGETHGKTDEPGLRLEVMKAEELGQHKQVTTEEDLVENRIEADVKGKRGTHFYKSAVAKQTMEIFLPTIRYMDHRRLKRQLQGVRKPLPTKRVMLFIAICLFILAFPYFYVDFVEDNINIGVSFSREASDVIPNVLLVIAIVIALIVFGRVQFSLSLQWAVYLLYIFVIGLITYLIVNASVGGTVGAGSTFVMLAILGATQLGAVLLVKLVIHVGPKLALSGNWLSWGENFRLLEKRKKSITMCRYNDFAGICGNNIFCFCFCFYRVLYRWFRRLIKCCSRYGRKTVLAEANVSRLKVEPPFSHQLRYRGSFDAQNRPHGFGEWLEDHPYGERIQGLWWHGYPIAPFTSQEIGSGSLFASTRVGVVACLGRDFTMRYGVSTTELSISGHFFNDFPNTFFLNHNVPKEYENSIPADGNHLIDYLLIKEEASGLNTQLEWCFKMLIIQACNPLSEDNGVSTLSVYFDRANSALRVNGYRYRGEWDNASKYKSINIQVVTNPRYRRDALYDDDAKPCKSESSPTKSESFRQGKKDSVPSTNLVKANSRRLSGTSSRTQHKQNDSTEEAVGLGEAPVENNSNTIEASETPDEKGKTENDNAESSGTKGPREHTVINSLLERYKTNRATNFYKNILKPDALTRKISEMATSYSDSEEDEAKYRIADVFEDEDARRRVLRSYQSNRAKVVVKNWEKLSRSLDEKTAEEILLFIPGYNVTISQGCAQAAHLAGFSNLPDYILPFIFHWDGAIGGIFSSLMYPKAKKRAANKKLAAQFMHLLRKFKSLGVKRLHILSHSCGTRALMNGLHFCHGKSIIQSTRRLVSNESDVFFDASDGMVIRSLILINPDYPLQQFVSEGFQLLHDYCNNICLYGDTRDQVLTFSETWNREKCVGKRIFDLCTPIHTLKTELTDIKGFTTESPLQQILTRRNVDTETARPVSEKENDRVVVNMETEYSTNSAGKSKRNLKTEQNIQNSISRGLKTLYSKAQSALPHSFMSSDDAIRLDVLMHPEKGFIVSPEISTRAKSSKNVWLDMDVVDTTFVDTHTDFLKHCFYQLSREIMDDIREIIVTGSRAHERVSRLDRRRGNVFCFRVAPASVRSIYK